MGSGGFGFGFGMAELFVVLMIVVTWLIPVVAGVWAVLTLHRIRQGQDAVRARLEAIERLLQRA
jgi:hypothetical protein